MAGRAHSNKPKHVFGAKFCRSCRKQAFCIDTRQTGAGHVTRRYRCSKCDGKWTTVEYRLDEKGGRSSSQTFLNAMKEQGADEALERVRDTFRKVLGI